MACCGERVYTAYVGCHCILAALVDKGLVPCTPVLCSSPLIRLQGWGTLHLPASQAAT